MDHSRFFNNNSSTSIMMMDTDELEDRYLDSRERDEHDTQSTSFRTRGHVQHIQLPRVLPFAPAVSSSSYLSATSSPKTPLYFGPGTSPSFRPRQRRESRHRPRTLQQYQASPSQQPQQQSATSLSDATTTPPASRTAAAPANQPSAADPPPSSQKRARTTATSTFASASAIISTPPATTSSRAPALPSTPSQTAVAPTPGPTPSTSFAANFMLGILKSGPQMPLPPKGTPQRLAELAKSTENSGRKASIAPGTVSSPLVEAKRAQLRKEFQERERKKKLERSRDLDDSRDDNDSSVADVEMATEIAGKVAGGAGAGSTNGNAAVGRPKKGLSVLDIIERTAGSGMGLPPRPAASSSSASISISLPAKRSAVESASATASSSADSGNDTTSTPAKRARVTDEGSSSAGEGGSKAADPFLGTVQASSAPSASSKPTGSFTFGPKASTSGVNASAALNSLPPAASKPISLPAGSTSTQTSFTPAKPVSVGNLFVITKPASAAVPASTASQPTLNAPAASAPSTTAETSVKLPSFEFGLDSTIEAILAAGERRVGDDADESGAKAKAMSLDSSKLPAFTFTF
ncbi:hypothetical protein OC845_002476 [Tilletia horrida]|nr:hypothetical protein OC845_002476 [Tilletia horrida]